MKLTLDSIVFERAFEAQITGGPFPEPDQSVGSSSATEPMATCLKLQIATVLEDLYTQVLPALRTADLNGMPHHGLDGIIFSGGFGGCKFVRSRLEELVRRDAQTGFHLDIAEIHYSRVDEPQLSVALGLVVFPLASERAGWQVQKVIYEPSGWLPRSNGVKLVGCT